MPWVPYTIADDAEKPARGKKREAKTQFYADHNFRSAFVEVLRQNGVDVITAADIGKATASDEEHLAIAKKLHRILLTHDHDFLDRRRFTTREGTGIFVLHGGDGSLSRLAQALRILLFIKMGHENWTTTILEITTDGTMNVRWWDKSAGCDRTARFRIRDHGFEEWVDEAP